MTGGFYSAPPALIPAPGNDSIIKSETMTKEKTRTSAYRHSRIIITRLFVFLLLILLVITGSRWETRAPLVSGVLFVSGCLLAGIASLGRLWCSLYIAGHKTRSLVVQGPYSLCRHPLYFFSFLGGIGVGLASETLTIPAVIIAVFIIYYPFVIRFEEEKMRTLHGQLYEDYCRQIPRFWPRWSRLTEPEEYCVFPKTFRKHLLSALIFIWMLGVLELIEMFRELDMFPTFLSVY